jgi:hypothetical protein
MKKIITILILVALTGCQMSSTTDNTSVTNDLTYFKDPKTGLCFASIGSIEGNGRIIVSIACVPCDSVDSLNGE